MQSSSFETTCLMPSSDVGHVCYLQKCVDQAHIRKQAFQMQNINNEQ